MSAQTLVAGVDSSTQSCKIVVCDAETRAVVRTARAPPGRDRGGPAALVGRLSAGGCGWLARRRVGHRGRWPAARRGHPRRWGRGPSGPAVGTPARSVPRRTWSRSSRPSPGQRAEQIGVVPVAAITADQAAVAGTRNEPDSLAPDTDLRPAPRLAPAPARSLQDGGGFQRAGSPIAARCVGDRLLVGAQPGLPRRCDGDGDGPNRRRRRCWRPTRSRDAPRRG